jgi:hypothetical protein
MRRRRVLLAFGLVVVLGLVAFVWWALSGPADGITPEVALRITDGMTEAEVAALLGRPADQEYRSSDPQPHPRIMAATPRPAVWDKQWVGERWIIYVTLDPAGRVCASAYGRTANNWQFDIVVTVLRWLGL